MDMIRSLTQAFTKIMVTAIVVVGGLVLIYIFLVFLLMLSTLH